MSIGLTVTSHRIQRTAYTYLNWCDMLEFAVIRVTLKEETSSNRQS